jgi:DNA polymerase-3 subunit gamma/tau
MNNKSLYLKYRPIQIDDVVGQRQVVATLKQSSINKSFSHAYLFSGNYGCGKTSTARILASLMSCEKVKDGKTCGECRPCKTIRSGSAIDVIELDGAKNGKVDDIKALIDAATYPPVELNNKIYILDECHELSDAAKSALLKIVEEPPSYLVFILCTTEITNMIAKFPTIVSRCQRFNFSKITSKDISQRLMYIAKQEKIEIDEDAVNVIAKIARGSMRDAISCLEQIATVAYNKIPKINAQHVQKYFGTSDRLGIINMAKAIIDGNIALILDQINDFVMASGDTKQVMFELTQVFRDIMVLKIQNVNSKIIDLPDNEIQELKKLGENLKVSQLLKMSQLFSDIDKKINYNINERWVMEATLINCVALLRKDTA